MTTRGARCNAGHFFRKILPAAFLAGLLTGCGGDPAEAGSLEFPASEGIPLLVEFCGNGGQPGLPESLDSLENTSWGRFHIFEEEPFDLFPFVFDRADSSGLLIFAVVPESLSLNGARDHLVILTGPSGIPVGTIPEMDPAFTAESLWEDPMVMQETLVELCDFFKPDIILIRMEAPPCINDMVQFWSRMPSTTCFYQPPDWSGNRGWGAICGEGIAGGPIDGMTPADFLATVLMTADLEWYGTGYPSMQVFTQSETE